jgi:hypothetical protein
MADALPENLTITMQPEHAGDFSLLLQQGFDVPVLVGCTLENLFTMQWQIAPDYVKKRIATIFLDSRPIDDLATAIIRENSVVALSGAMPGLVGATMRRDGFYANLRSNITYRELIPETPKVVARIHVKIFNILLPELGPDFLQRGIILGIADLAYFLMNKTATFWQYCTSAELNGLVIASAQLCEKIRLSGSKTIYLRVIAN